MYEHINWTNISSVNTNSSIHHTILAVKVGTSSVSCLLNVVAILVLVVGGSYKKHAVRLVLYFLIANFLLVLVKALQILPVHYSHEDGAVQVRKGWDDACCVVAFFAQITVWMRNLVFLFIILHIFILVKNPVNFWQQQSDKAKMGEMLGVCFCFLLPFTFNWIPFLNDYYGLSGHWCWIKPVENGCLTDGLIFMSLLYFVPLLLIMLLTSLLCLYVLCKWCISSNKRIEIVLVILYPIIFDALYVVITYNRIDSVLRARKNDPPELKLWLPHTIADTGITVLPPVCVILMLFCSTSRNLLVPRIMRNNDQEDARIMRNNDQEDEVADLIQE